MIKPLNDQVLIEAVLDDRSAGGVLLPDSAKEQGQTRKGKVLGVGPGKKTDYGEFITTDVKEGDIVWFDVYAASRVDSDDPVKPKFLIPAGRVLAVETK